MSRPSPFGDSPEQNNVRVAFFKSILNQSKDAVSTHDLEKANIYF